MKKVLALALAFALVLSLGMSAIAATGAEIWSDWDDVGDSYKTDVLRLSIDAQGLNVFQGDNGKFNPKSTFTRAELLAVVAIVDLGGNPDKKALNDLFATDAQRGEKFSDVPATHWAFAAINYAARMGYTEGDGTGKFNPDGIVTSDMLYSFCLSLLGFQKEDMNGADWIGKVGTLLRTYGLKGDIDSAVNYNVTREEVAKVLSKTINQSKYIKDRTNGTYSKDGDKTLLGNFDGSGKKEAGSIEIEGKVIKTKYAALEGATDYPDNSVVIWKPTGKDTNGAYSGTIYQIDDPSDDFVPTQYLGRYVKVDVVRTGTSGNSHYRQATGAKATASYNNDLVGINLDEDKGVTAYVKGTFDATFNNSWYGWTQNYVNEDLRGAYTNYDVDTFDTSDNNLGGWACDGSGWNYAYAVRDINVQAYTEVFFLNYVALEVGSTNKSGKTTLNYLDGCEYATIDLGDVEFGDTAKKGDIIVGVTNSDHDNLVTLEVIPAQKGTKRLSRNGVDVDGKWYDVATTLTGGMLDEPDFEEIDKGKTYDWYIFTPVYNLLTGWNETVMGAFWSSALDPDEIEGLVGHSDNGVIINGDGSVELGSNPGKAATVIFLTVVDNAGNRTLYNDIKTNKSLTIGNDPTVLGTALTGWDSEATASTAEYVDNTDAANFVVALILDASGRVIDKACSAIIGVFRTAIETPFTVTNATFDGTNFVFTVAYANGAKYDTAAGKNLNVTPSNNNTTLTIAKASLTDDFDIDLAYADWYTGDATVSLGNVKETNAHTKNQAIELNAASITAGDVTGVIYNKDDGARITATFTCTYDGIVKVTPADVNDFDDITVVAIIKQGNKVVVVEDTIAA